VALTTYQELLDAAKSWLNREDSKTIDRIPDFVTFGENRIFRKLRTRANEEKTTYLATAGDNTVFVTLPDDFKEVKFVLYDGKALTRKSDQYLLSKDPSAKLGPPIYYARLINELHWWRSAEENADVVLYYYNQQAHISASEIPDLYLEAPELYLWAALLEAAPFLKHKDKISIWQGKFDGVFNELMDESWQAEFAGSTVEVSNIYEDSLSATDGKNSYIR
jgi:hypothetical protein